MLDDFVDPSDSFVKQPNKLYGNKIADILSFLDEDTKKSYIEYLRTKTIANPKNIKDLVDGKDTGNVSSDEYQQQMSDLTTVQYINETKNNGLTRNKQLEDQLSSRLGGDLTDLQALQIKTVSKVLNPGLTLDADMKSQFVIAATANGYYLAQLEKAIDALYKLHGNRLEFNKNFYNTRTGVSSRVPFYGTYNSNAGITTNIVTGMGNNVSNIVSNNSVENQLQSSAKILYQLVIVGALQPNSELNIRPINIKTGNFEIPQEDIDYNRTARKLKLPLKGSFVINDRTTSIGKTYNTFTGVDITVSYAIGYVVGNLKSMRAITWSIHRGKPHVPIAEEVPPTYRARGKRCIPATEKVYIKDKGYIPINEVQVGDWVQSTPTEFNKVLGVYNQGIKDCNTVKLRNGYDITSSFDHPIYTERGWVEADKLVIGDLVYTSGNVPFTNQEDIVSDDILKLVAYLIGDGSIHIYPKKNGGEEYRISLSISDKEMDTIGKETEEILNRLNISFKDNRKNSDKCISRRISVCIGEGQTDWRLRVYNELHKTLLKYELYQTYSHTKFIPQDFVSNLNKRQAALFLSRLFSTDGCYSVSGTNDKYMESSYCSTSEILIDQIRILLAKFSINCIKLIVKEPGDVGGKASIISKHTSYQLTISNSLDLARFVKFIGIFSKDYIMEGKYKTIVSRIVYNLPIDYESFLERIKDIVISRKQSVSRFRNKHNFYVRDAITVKHALKIAQVLEDESLIQYVNEEVEKFIFSSNSDFLKFPVISNTKKENLEVFDLEVEERHSFICEFMLVHNTIAGTLIFANFDEHPITAIYPSSFFPKDPDFGENNPIRPDFIKPDQLPAFDLFVILTNEYGWASLLALYGVEIMDDGGSFSMDDLLSEEVIQYTAKDVDLLHKVKTDKHGLIDPFELSNLQSQSLFKKRSEIVYGDEGAAHYGSYDESIRNFSNANATKR